MTRARESRPRPEFDPKDGRLIRLGAALMGLGALFGCGDPESSGSPNPSGPEPSGPNSIPGQSKSPGPRPRTRNPDAARRAQLAEWAQRGPTLYLWDRDREIGRPLRRITIGVDGQPTEGRDRYPALSGDGERLVFSSDAPGLVLEDTDPHFDVFLWSRSTDSLEHISIELEPGSPFGDALFPAMSADGDTVLFSVRSQEPGSSPEDSGGLEVLYERRRAEGQTALLLTARDGGLPNGSSRLPSMSADGRWVVFQSLATNLTQVDFGGAPPDRWNAYLFDRESDRLWLLSRTPDGRPGNGHSDYVTISADGSTISFQSDATDLHPEDANGPVDDIFLVDRARWVEEGPSVPILASRTPNGGWPDERSWIPTLSANGLRLAYESKAGNLVSGDQNGTWDIFVLDRGSGETHRVNVSSLGVEGDLVTRYPAISTGGDWVVYQSRATTLVPDDSNGTWDVFLQSSRTGALRVLSVTPDGKTGNGPSGSSCPSVSEDGRFVAFTTRATNL